MTVTLRKQIAVTSGGPSTLVRENLAGGKDSPTIQAPFACKVCGKRHSTQAGAKLCARQHTKRRG